MKLPVRPVGSPAAYTPSTSQIETCISQQTFRKLCFDIQLDYARNYRLSDVEDLTSDEICSSLFKESEWTPALDLEGHVRIATPDGVVVARGVMDLVDWLVEHHTTATTTTNAKLYADHNTHDNPDRIHERRSLDDLQRKAEELKRAHEHIKTRVEESRLALREACADLFILQNRLNEENACQSRTMKAMTSILRMELMQEIEEKIDVETREGHSLVEPKSHNAHKDAKQRIQELGTKNRRRNTNPNSYHVFTRLPSPQCSTSRSSASSKRKLRPEDNGHADITPARKNKRPRIEESSQPHDFTNDTLIAQTILNYPSDDNGDEDSSYSDSNGTERDFIDDHYSFFGPHGKPPLSEELWSSNSSACGTDVEPSDLAQSFRWSATESDSDCSSDPDYQPLAEWDLEDVLELDIYRLEINGPYPLYSFKYIDALLDCGGALSNGGVSTDNPDQAYLHPEMLQRSAFNDQFPESLGHRLVDDPLAEYELGTLGQEILTFDDKELARLRQWQITRSRSVRWGRVKADLQYNRSWATTIDVDRRLDEILASDHFVFYFDDLEWMHFVEPSSNVFSPYVLTRPRYTQSLL